MCEHGPITDPRDDIMDAEAAIWGLASLLTEHSNSENVDGSGVAALLRLFHYRLGPAAREVQGYQPKE
jgi:hypothetical protein